MQNSNPAAQNSVALPVALMLVLAGCQGPGATGPAGPPTPPPEQVLGATWSLVAMGGESVDRERRTTLEFRSNGSFSGVDQGTPYSGQLLMASAGLGRGSVQFGGITSASSAASADAMNYLDMLSRCDAYRADGGLLELSTAGAPALRYRKISGGR